jgi:poly(A) polymerase
MADDLLNEIGARLARRGECYYVGGCVRDMLRGESVKDLDFVLSGSTHDAGRELARAYNGHVFWLREEEGVVRVLLPDQDGLNIDLCPLKGTIAEDLAARDLTINALAIPAAAGLDARDAIIDVTGGLADLEARLLRFVAPSAPVDDPLRTLRAVRFKWKLGFHYAPGTVERVRECLPRLRQVSGERIRDELFQLLAMPDPSCALAEALSLGFGRWLLGREVSLPLTGGEPASAANLRRLATRLNAATGDLASLMASIPTAPRTRREVALWASVLQPLATQLDLADAARSLALSAEERTLIIKGIAGAKDAERLVQASPAPGREHYRFLKKAGPAGPEAILLSGLSSWTSSHEELMDEALDWLLRPRAPLLTGQEVMEVLSVEPGPVVGKALEAIAEARADGLISTVGEARAWLTENFRA